MRQRKAYAMNRNKGRRYKHKKSHKNSEPSTPHPSLWFLPPINLSSCQSHQSHHWAPHTWQTGPSSPPWTPCDGRWVIQYPFVLWILDDVWGMEIGLAETTMLVTIGKLLQQMWISVDNNIHILWLTSFLGKLSGASHLDFNYQDESLRCRCLLRGLPLVRWHGSIPVAAPLVFDALLAFLAAFLYDTHGSSHGGTSIALKIPMSLV